MNCQSPYGIFNSITHNSCSGGCEIPSKYIEPSESPKYGFVPDERRYVQAKNRIREFISGNYNLKEIEDDAKYLILHDIYNRKQKGIGNSSKYADLGELQELYRDLSVEFNADLGENIYGVTEFGVSRDVQSPKTSVALISYSDSDFHRYLRESKLPLEFLIYGLKEEKKSFDAYDPRNQEIHVNRVAIDRKTTQTGNRAFQAYVLLHELAHVAQKNIIGFTRRDYLENEADDIASGIVGELVSGVQSDLTH